MLPTPDVTTRPSQNREIPGFLRCDSKPSLEQLEGGGSRFVSEQSDQRASLILVRWGNLLDIKLRIKFALRLYFVCKYVGVMIYLVCLAG